MELILSDGTREYDFLADGDIYVQQEGIQLPVVSDENTYAEGSDSEGRTRIRSRATNSEAGSFSVYFKATNADDFWDAVDNLQELVLSAHRNKGTITYTPPGGVAVTFGLEAINVTDLPQKGVHLQQFHGEATVSFETKPYGRLDTQPLQPNGETYAEIVAELGELGLFLPLTATDGLTDLSGEGHDGVASTSTTVGGVVGPLVVNDDGATAFDDAADKIVTPYRTRRNLAPRACAQATYWTHTFTNVTDAGSGLGNGAWSPDSGNSQYYVKGTATAGSAKASANFGSQSTNYVTVAPGDVYLISVDLHIFQRGVGSFTGVVRFYTNTPTYVAEVATQPITGLYQDRYTWRVTVPAGTATRMHVHDFGHLGTLANGETAEFSVADLMIEKESGYKARLGDELHDNFLTKPDGALGTADTGQTWVRTTKPTPNDTNMLTRISSGRATWAAVNAGSAASYNEIDLGDTVSTIGGSFAFTDAGVDSDGYVVFLVTRDPVYLLQQHYMPIHFTISRTTWTIDVWNNGTMTTVLSGSFSPSLAANTDYYAQARISGNAIYAELPDGTTRVARHAYVATNGGNWADMELFANTASTATQPTYSEFWADTRPVDAMELPGVGFFPTVAQLADGSAGWLGTANASASEYGPCCNGVGRSFVGWVKMNEDASGLQIPWSPGGTVRYDLPIQIDPADGDCLIHLGGTSHNLGPAAFADKAGEWCHVAVTADEPGDIAKLYLNGELVYTNSGMTSQWGGGSNSNPAFGLSYYASQEWEGDIGPFTIHKSVLTADEVRSAYNAGLAQVDLAGPIGSLTVENVDGHVPALCNLTLTDSDSEARNIVEVGVQHDVDPDNLEPILLEAVTDLDALGGASSTRSGSHSTNIVRSALAPTPIAVCTAAGQPHKGRWKIRTRVYPSATTVLVRLAWRAGDGPFAKEKWVAVPNSAGWFDLDLGTVNIKELPSGHTCEFRIEAKSTSGSPTVDVDIVECIPADSYTKLRGSSASEVGTGAIVAMDDFSTQTSGAVTGKTPLLAPSGNWSGAGDADDFTVDTTNQWITRTAVSDSALNNGRYLRCGSGTLAAAIVQVDYSASTGSGPGRFGVFLRYVDTSNWLMAVYDGFVTISLIKRVAGTETVLGTCFTDPSGASTRTIVCGAGTLGNVLVYEGPKDGTLSPVILVLGDSTLATAGAIASGGYGIYDATTAASGVNRYYDNFIASTLATDATIINPAINSGYGLDLKHNTALTDNATGTGQGTTPIREGQYLTLPPSTRNNSVHRIVTRARRNDGELGFADEGLDDALTASLEVTPRVHLTGT